MRRWKSWLGCRLGHFSSCLQYNDCSCDVEACIVNYLPVTAEGAIGSAPTNQRGGIPAAKILSRQPNVTSPTQPLNLKLVTTSARWARSSKCLVYVLIIQLMRLRLTLYSCRSLAVSTSKSPMSRTEEALADFHIAPYFGEMPPS